MFALLSRSGEQSIQAASLEHVGFVLCYHGNVHGECEEVSEAKS
jgi:hypothetical protein